MAKVSTSPLVGAWWLDPGLIMCGPHPSGLTDRQTAARVHALLRAGLRLFIDLTLPDEGQKPYEALLMATAKRLEMAANRLSFPVLDLTTPSVPLMEEILATVDASLHRNQPVYLHCLAGVGRTGTVACCWFVRQGVAAEAAMAEAQKRSRTAYNSRWLTVPENDRQRDFVRRWEMLSRQGR